eukprot:m51a1_g5111 hypothetical protein (1015) ;mRNA; f:342713-346810
MPLYGAPLAGALGGGGKQHPVPDIVAQCVAFLKPLAKTTDGLLVKEASPEGVADMSAVFEEAFGARRPAQIAPDSDPHAVGGALRLYLSSLPTPLLASGPRGLASFTSIPGTPRHLTHVIDDGEEGVELHKMVMASVSELPGPEQATLREMVTLLRAVASQSATNHVRLSTLAASFAPALIPAGSSTKDTMAARKVLAALIKYGLKPSVATSVSSVSPALASPGSKSPIFATSSTPESPKAMSLCPQYAELTRAQLEQRLAASEAALAETRERLARSEREVEELRAQIRTRAGDEQEMMGYIRTLQQTKGLGSPLSPRRAELEAIEAKIPAVRPSPLAFKSVSHLRLRSMSANALAAEKGSKSLARSLGADEFACGSRCPLRFSPLVAANNVQSADPNGFSDPYCILKLGHVKHRSKTIKKTLNPRWDEKFSFKNVNMQDSLIVEVWDWDAIGSDDFLGVFDVPLCTLSDGKPKECRYVLEPKKKECVSGDVHLVMQCTSAEATPNLSVGQVANLRPLVHLGSGQLIVRNPYVVMRVDKQVGRTEVIEKTLRPRWDTTFYFEANESSKLELIVKDWNMVKSNQPIGEVKYPVKNLLMLNLEEVKDEWLPLAPLKEGAAPKQPTCGAIHIMFQYTPSVAIPTHQIAHSDFFKTEADCWSSTPQARELWAENPSLASLLVDKRNITEEGCRVEAGRSYITSHFRDAEGAGAAAAGTFDVQITFPYYAQHLYGTDHVTYFGSDVNFGPVVVAVGSPDQQGFRKVMVMTKREDKRFVVPNNQGYLRAIKVAYPILQSIKLDKTKATVVQDALAKFEHGNIVRRYKFGVLYAKPGQKEELAMFNNVETSAAFEEFLKVLGDSIELKDWKYYRGGLDTKADHTGRSSVYTTYRDIEVMFHVATLIPHKPRDPQQVDRKRHIGNDVVVVILKEREGSDDTVNIGSFISHFNHVFVVVSPERASGEDVYRVNVVVKPAVGTTAPYLPDPPLLRKTPELRDWLLQKRARDALPSPFLRSETFD